MKELLLLAILSLPVGPVVRADQPRLEALAEELAEVPAEDGAAGSGLLFGGPMGHEASSLAVLAATYHESGLQERIEHCDCHGHECDDGRALGIGQVLEVNWNGHAREEICRDRRLQVKLAYRVLALMKNKCRVRGDSLRMFRGYSSGNCDAPGDTAEATNNVFTRLLARSGIVLLPSGRAVSAAKAPSRAPAAATAR